MSHNESALLLPRQKSANPLGRAKRWLTTKGAMGASNAEAKIPIYTRTYTRYHSFTHSLTHIVRDPRPVKAQCERSEGKGT